jgi:von Willebrand factor type A domain
MKKIRIILLVIMTLFSITSHANTDTSKIQIALIIDVSGSMNGLLNQVQSQFWKMVTFLENVKRRKDIVALEFAILTVGNAEFNDTEQTGIISQFTSHFDCLLDKIINLNTSGGDENFGQGIQWALDSLSWSSNKKDFKSIIIAGNEPFNQGKYNYKIECEKAKEREILINAIYCGDYDEGIKNEWFEASKMGNGRYTFINQNDTLNTDTPFDLSYKGFYRSYQNPFVLIDSLDNCSDEDFLLGKSSSFFRDYVNYKILDSKNKNDLVTEYIKDTTCINRIDFQKLPLVFSDFNKQKLITTINQFIHKRKVIIEGMVSYNFNVEEYLDIKHKKRKTKVLFETVKTFLKIQLNERGFAF